MYCSCNFKFEIILKFKKHEIIFKVFPFENPEPLFFKDSKREGTKDQEKRLKKECFISKDVYLLHAYGKVWRINDDNRTYFSGLEISGVILFTRENSKFKSLNKLLDQM